MVRSFGGRRVQITRFKLSAFATAGAVLGPKRLPTIGRQPSGEIFVSFEGVLADMAPLHYCTNYDILMAEYGADSVARDRAERERRSTSSNVTMTLRSDCPHRSRRSGNCAWNFGMSHMVSLQQLEIWLRETLVCSISRRRTIFEISQRGRDALCVRVLRCRTYRCIGAGRRRRFGQGSVSCRSFSGSGPHQCSGSHLKKHTADRLLGDHPVVSAAGVINTLLRPFGEDERQRVGQSGGWLVHRPGCLTRGRPIRCAERHHRELSRGCPPEHGTRNTGTEGSEQFAF